MNGLFSIISNNMLINNDLERMISNIDNFKVERKNVTNCGVDFCLDCGNNIVGNVFIPHGSIVDNIRLSEISFKYIDEIGEDKKYFSISGFGFLTKRNKELKYLEKVLLTLIRENIRENKIFAF